MDVNHYSRIVLKLGAKPFWGRGKNLKRGEKHVYNHDVAKWGEK
jgi:hypothetical protein